MTLKDFSESARANMFVWVNEELIGAVDQIDERYMDLPIWSKPWEDDLDHSLNVDFYDIVECPKCGKWYLAEDLYARESDVWCDECEDFVPEKDWKVIERQ